MIFAAGYNLKRRTFFKYFLYIFIFGILGTLISFSVIAPLTYLTNKADLFKYTFRQPLGNDTNIKNNELEYYNLNFSLSEILLFSSVITATDTVAALTFVKENTDPKLFSIMLGEGVINDAVCIVLYKIIQSFSNEKKGNIYQL